MTNHKFNRKYLPLLVTVIIVASGCSQKLPKSEELLAAEKFYQKTATNPEVTKYATTELIKANDSLKAASQAKNHEEMNALAHISKNQTGIAIKNAEIKASTKRIGEIMDSLSEQNKGTKVE